MPYSFGARSKAKLNTVHPRLQNVFLKAIGRSPYDFTIVHGLRGKDIQNTLFESGASTKKYPFSRHNTTQDPTIPLKENVSDAVDFAPWINGGIPWNETHIFAAIYGVLAACAEEEGIRLRWGGDWNGNGVTSDQTLMDWGHVEIQW